MRTHLAPVLAILLVSACGGDQGAGSCAAGDDPIVLTIADPVPEPDSIVANAAIVHSFTIVDAPGIFQTFSLLAGPDHTAGVLTSTPRVLGKASDHDLHYTMDPAEWTVAPGHVQFGFAGRYEGPDGCQYEFPATVFEYDVALPGPGGEISDGAALDGGNLDGASDVVGW